MCNKHPEVISALHYWKQKKPNHAIRRSTYTQLLWQHRLLTEAEESLEPLALTLQEQLQGHRWCHSLEVENWWTLILNPHWSGGLTDCFLKPCIYSSLLIFSFLVQVKGDLLIGISQALEFYSTFYIISSLSRKQRSVMTIAFVPRSGLGFGPLRHFPIVRSHSLRLFM